jgi:hypothetical protein
MPSMSGGGFAEGVTAFLGSTIASLGVFGDNNDTTGIGFSSLISLWSFEVASGSGTNSSWHGATPHNIGVNRWNSATSFNSSQSH